MQLTITQFCKDLAGAQWGNLPLSSLPGWGVSPASKMAAHLSSSTANYICGATFRPDAGGRFVRKSSLWIESYMLLIDDVGTKLDEAACRMFLPEPTYRFETSPGNFQWGYFFKEPCRDARVMNALISAIIANKAINPSGKDPGMKGLTRVFRTPVGANIKPAVIAANGGFPFQTVIHTYDAQVRYSVEELASSLGVSLDDATLEAHREVLGSTGPLSRETINSDPVLLQIKGKGMLLGVEPNDEGFIDIICPWAHEHSDPRPEAGYKIGGGGFQCHHGHCQDKTMNDLRTWLCENVTDEEANGVARDIFDEVYDELDEGLEAEVEAARARAAAAGERVSDWVYVPQLDKFGHVPTRVLYPEKVFNKLAPALAPAGSGGQRSAASIFINLGGRIVEEVTYAPGEPVFCKTDLGTHSATAFNLWRPGPVQPYPFDVDVNDLKVWLDHVEYILPDPVARELFFDWAAYVVQNPGGKVNWGYVLLGDQGIGKDAMLRAVMALLGLWNVSLIDVETFESQWSYWLEAQMVVIGELPAFGKKSLYDKLKLYVCTGQGKHIVNKKHQNQYWIRDFQNWFIFSNHEDALALPADDRRFFVYASPAVKQDEAYYQAVGALQHDGVFLSKLKAWLMDRDMSKFNPWAAPPVTQAKLDMAAAAEDAVERWVREELASGAFMGRRLVRVEEIMSHALRVGAVTPKEVRDKLNHARVGKVLKKLGGVHLGQHRLPGRGIVKLWATSGGVLYKQMSATQLAEAYEKDISSAKDVFENVSNETDNVSNVTEFRPKDEDGAGPF